MIFLPLSSTFNQVDPVAILVVPLMIYAADRHVVQNTGASISFLGKRLLSFLCYHLLGRLSGVL